MSSVTEVGMAGAEEGFFSARSDEPEARSEVRWSAWRKEGVVMRLLGGESLGLLRARTGSLPGGSACGAMSFWRVAAGA